MRAAAVLGTGPSATRFADAGAYLNGARLLAETGSYPRETEPHLFRPPGFPVFLVAATLGHPDRIAAARFANAALGALVPGLLAALSARLFRRRALALATGVLAAIHPSFVLAASDLQSEPLFLVFLLAAAYLLLAAADRPSSNLAVLAGVCLALATLTRSIGLALTPFLLAPLLDRRYPRRADLHVALSALLGFGAALLPWTLRNAAVFHELLLVNDGAGVIFWGRNSDAALGLAEAPDRAALRQAVEALERRRSQVVASLPDDVRRSPGALSRAMTRAALAERAANWAGTRRLLAWKIGDWLRPYPDPRFWPRWIVLGGGLYYAALFLLAAVGLARAERRGAAACAAAFLAWTMLVHVLLETNWRYRAALWDPVLLLYAAFAAWLLLRPAAAPAAA